MDFVKLNFKIMTDLLKKRLIYDVFRHIYIFAVILPFQQEHSNRFSNSQNDAEILEDKTLEYYNSQPFCDFWKLCCPIISNC